MSDSDAVLFFFFFFMAVSCSFSSSSASWRPPSLRTAQKKNCYSQDFSAAVGKLRDRLSKNTSFLPFLQLLLSRRLLFWLRLFLLRLTWLIFDVWSSVSLLLLLYAALDRLKQQHISGMFKKKRLTHSHVDTVEVLFFTDFIYFFYLGSRLKQQSWSRRSRGEKSSQWSRRRILKQTPWHLSNNIVSRWFIWGHLSTEETDRKSINKR